MTEFEFRLLFVFFALCVDGVWGDPETPYHPIRAVGALITGCLAVYHKMRIENHWAQFLFGVVMALGVVGTSVAFILLILHVATSLGWFTHGLVEVFFCYILISPKELCNVGERILKSLKKEDLSVARKQLSYIVGRDTQNLSSESIVKATVETILENFCDGVIAPLFYILLGGIPLGVAYKVFNTLDSMVGYRNGTFEYVGKFSARMDDALNFIPARLSAGLLLCSGGLMHKDTRHALRVYVADRHKHLSPNSAHTEAMGAGLLGISLGGSHYYGGQCVEKPTIGTALQKATPEKIKEASSLMYRATWLGLSLAVVAFFLIERVGGDVSLFTRQLHG